MNLRRQPGVPREADTMPPMTLRLKIHLIVGLLTLAFVGGIAGVQLVAMRDSVKEEVAAANLVAAQLLRRTGWLQAAQGTPAMVAYLQGLGRVRANDIVLTDRDGRVLYQSPPSPYKAGRDAPAWFAWLIAPAPSVQTVEFADGRLELRANASRAVLDAWDSLSVLAATALGLLLAVNLLVFWLVGRTVRPFAQIVDALGALQAGRFDTQLPKLPGKEAGAIGSAFNRMVAVLNEHIETEKRAVRAEGQLGDQRELANWVEHRLDQERRAIARELHDELGQAVTAMRSIALSLAQHTQGADAQAARLIADECARLYDAMHGLIPRLAPLVLDALGLGEALADLAERLRAAHPGVAIELRVELGQAALSPDAALTLYRAAQEGITNALRHGGARQLQLLLGVHAGGLRLRLRDDGQGLGAQGTQRPGHFGLRWLAERARSLGGTLAVAPRTDGPGVELTLELPVAAPAPAEAAA
jgi:two-component system sensor histidine kinase UhpB